MEIIRPAVFIFGAGATRGAFEDSKFSPPIDRDFFDIAGQLQGHGTDSLARQVLNSVWDLYGETRGISLERYYRDIETREVIGRFVKPPNQPMRWGRRRMELEELIRRVYIHTACDTEGPSFSPKASSIHRDILKHLTAGDTIVTFNYDLVIEESFAQSSLWQPTDGYGVKVHGGTRGWCRNWLKSRKESEAETITESSISLLKLHGSLNWRLYNNQQIRLKDRPYVVRRNRNNKPGIENIAILPPGWKKEGIERQPYSTFWRMAGGKLQNCKSIVILGYSLPETDLLAQALFAEVIRSRAARSRRNYLKQLYLADPSETVKEKFSRLFSPALGPLGELFKYKDIREFAKDFNG
ncbi:MAG: SIR2 family protein [Elusimicrobia bacterium]|nr:SIR2 family protein [Elusimicrobiota bacterium]